jgi:hypothetical protein
MPYEFSTYYLQIYMLAIRINNFPLFVVYVSKEQIFIHVDLVSHVVGAASHMPSNCQVISCTTKYKTLSMSPNLGFFSQTTTRNSVVCNQSLCNWHATGCRLQLSRSCLQL